MNICVKQIFLTCLLCVTMNVAWPKEQQDISEFRKQVKLTEEGCLTGLLRDVREVFIVISQEGVISLAEDNLRRKIEYAMKENGIGVVSEEQYFSNLCMPPVLVLSISTTSHGPVISYTTRISIADWMHSLSNFDKCVFCPCYYVSNHGFSSPSIVQHNIEILICDLLETTTTLWKQSLSLCSNETPNEPLQYIELTDEQLESMNNYTILHQALLTDLKEISVWIDIEDALSSLINISDIKKGILAELEAFDIKNISLSEGYQRMLTTGKPPMNLRLKVTVAESTRGNYGYLVELILLETMVRASVPDYALNCPVYIETFYGASTSYDLKNRLQDTMNRALGKLVQDLKQVKENPSLILATDKRR